MAKQKVYICFDNVGDRPVKSKITGWEDPNYEFIFPELAPQSMKDWKAAEIEAVLLPCIKESAITLVMVGRFSNTIRKNSEGTGSKNWTNYEIAKSKEDGNKLVAHKLAKQHTNPDELKDVEVEWAAKFTQEDIVAALDAVTKK